MGAGYNLDSTGDVGYFEDITLGPGEEGRWWFHWGFDTRHWQRMSFMPEGDGIVTIVSETFEHDVYTPFALLSDLGVPDTAARVVTVGLGLAVLEVARRRRSLGLALAAALVLSPIVWRHFFTLLLVPLALSRPRFDVVWLVPVGMWIGDGTLNGAPWQTAGVLALAATTFVLCERAPRRDGAAVHSRGPAPLPI